MRHTGKILSWILAGVSSFGLLGLAACRATVAGDPDRPIKIEAHITVDIRQVKEAATSIEDQVSGGAPAKTSALDFLEARAWADEPELKVVTPAVQEAINARRSRYDQLKALKAQGVLGENNEGHVAVLTGDADAEKLAAEENNDREVIYKAIVEQNKLGRDAITTIRTTFGEVQREKASAGEKIQNPAGEWVTK